MQAPTLEDSTSVKHVVLYLRAFNKIFERGILKKKGFIKLSLLRVQFSLQLRTGLSSSQNGRTRQ